MVMLAATARVGEDMGGEAFAIVYSQYCLH